MIIYLVNSTVCLYYVKKYNQHYAQSEVNDDLAFCYVSILFDVANTQFNNIIYFYFIYELEIVLLFFKIQKLDEF